MTNGSKLNGKKILLHWHLFKNMYFDFSSVFNAPMRHCPCYTCIKIRINQSRLVNCDSDEYTPATWIWMSTMQSISFPRIHVPYTGLRRKNANVTRFISIVQWVNFVKSIVTHIHFDAYKSQKQSPNVILLTKCKWLNENIRIAIILLSSFRQLYNVFLCWSNNFMLAFSVAYNRRYTQIRKLCKSLSGFSSNEKCRK